VLFFLYYFLTEYFFGKTLAKLITQTSVVSIEGETPTAGQLAIRTFARLVPVDFLTYFNAYPTGWHDTLSGVYVIQKRPGEVTLPDIEVSSTIKWWRRFWVFLTVFILFCGLIIPVFTIVRWQNPAVAPADVSEWNEEKISSQLTLALPRGVRQVAPGLWRARLIGVQSLEIERFASVLEVENHLREEFSLLSQTPFLIIEFSDYVSTGGSGSYRYRLNQVPVAGDGFWVTADEGDVYMVRFVGFGVDVKEALSVIQESAIVN